MVTLLQGIRKNFLNSQNDLEKMLNLWCSKKYLDGLTLSHDRQTLRSQGNKLYASENIVQLKFGKWLHSKSFLLNMYLSNIIV